MWVFFSFLLRLLREEVSGAFAKGNHACWKLCEHLRVVGPTGDGQVQEVENRHPFAYEGQKGEVVMWIPRKEPGGCTGAGVRLL